MPNTGKFHLYEVAPADSVPDNTTYPPVGVVRAECLSCFNLFTVSEEPGLTNIPGGGAAVVCSKCGSRQAISGARFAEFMERFPTGSDAAARLIAMANSKAGVSE